MGGATPRSCSRKSRKKEQNSVFKKGNKLHLKRLRSQAHIPNDTKCTDNFPRTKRYSQCEWESFVIDNGEVFSIPDAQGKEGTARLLRPKKEAPPNFSKLKKPAWNTSDECNMILEMNRFMECINKAIKEHAKTNHCSDLQLKLTKTTPYGCYIRTAMSCNNCDFQTDKQAMYAEISRTKESSKEATANKSTKAPSRGPTKGPKGAKGNLRLGYILLHSSIGPTKLRFFLAALGLRPISRTRLQALTAKAADKTVKLNEIDMNHWLKKRRKGATRQRCGGNKNN